MVEAAGGGLVLFGCRCRSACRALTPSTVIAVTPARRAGMPVPRCRLGGGTRRPCATWCRLSAAGCRCGCNGRRDRTAGGWPAPLRRRSRRRRCFRRRGPMMAVLPRDSQSSVPPGALGERLCRDPRAPRQHLAPRDPRPCADPRRGTLAHRPDRVSGALQHGPAAPGHRPARPADEPDAPRATMTDVDSERIRRKICPGRNDQRIHPGWAARRGPGFTNREAGPFPRSLPPNPAGTFRCTGLSGDLCRVRDGVRVDVVVAGGADDEGFPPHFRHERCPRGLAWSRLAEAGEPGDLVDCHRGAVLAQFALPPAEPVDQLLARERCRGRGRVADDRAPVCV